MDTESPQNTITQKEIDDLLNRIADAMGLPSGFPTFRYEEHTFLTTRTRPTCPVWIVRRGERFAVFYEGEVNRISHRRTYFGVRELKSPHGGVREWQRNDLNMLHEWLSHIFAWAGRKT